MNEKPVAVIGNADPLSQLLQLRAHRAGVSLRWTGKGREDLDMVFADLSAKTLMSKRLWEGLKELMELKSVRELPEDVQAQLSSIILTARTNFHLDLEARNERAKRFDPPAPFGVG